jgi:hypothetical protein
VPFGFAPHSDDLGHDAGEIRVHEARVQGAGRPFGDEIDDADAQLTQRSPEARCLSRWSAKAA